MDPMRTRSLLTCYLPPFEFFSPPDSESLAKREVLRLTSAESSCASREESKAKPRIA